MTVEETGKEKLGFQTEVKQLLGLMINSLYSNKEIFLRELVSNASDAADKLRFEALSNQELYEGDGDLKIRVSYDKDARTVTVSDNGVGMSRQEVIDNVGTIAKSGTRQFFDSLTGDEARDAQLIGQFGVGFYSSFIVAERVTLISRRAGAPREEGVRWESTGEGEFTVENLDRAKRGTEVVLHLKDGEDEFLDGSRLRNILRLYSDHISLPVVMQSESDEEGEAGDETVNSATALWTRPKGDISDDEYEEFYKHVSHDYEAPLAHVHSRVEGNLEYTSLLYIPARAPFDLWDRSTRRGVKLYVRRVFIMDDAENLMPNFLRFVRGVIDSSDLPLNVSREILQQNKQIDSMRAGSTKKVLSMLEGLATNEADQYEEFWTEFGRVLKEGLIEDSANRESIAKLSRFATTHTTSEKQSESLADYVGRMKEGQDKIFFITAANYGTASNSPHLEVFKKNGIEVLLLTDDVDEIAFMHLMEFDGHALQAITKGDLDLGDLIEKNDDQAVDDAAHDAFIERVKASLGDTVKDVRITHRLTDSPACLVADDHEMSAHLERLMRSAGQAVPGQTPIMELNPDHAIVKALAEQSDGASFDDWTHILFDQALLSEGGQLKDPSSFVRRLNQMLTALFEAPAKPVKKKATRKKKPAAKAEADKSEDAT
jgi:molecular chaperone HtpG